MHNNPRKGQGHEMGYLGAYTVDNVESLKMQAKRGGIREYFMEHATEPRQVDASRETHGILFGCIQWGKKSSTEQFFVIRTKFGEHDVLVATPRPLDPERHTDGKGIFEPPHFGDESAKYLLDDLIRINPENRPDLERIWETLG